MESLKGVVVLMIASITINVNCDVNLATQDQFPYHVYIDGWRNTEVNDSGQVKTYLSHWNCSGAILSERAVITSFFCASGNIFNWEYAFGGISENNQNITVWYRIKIGCVNPFDPTCIYHHTNQKPSVPTAIHLQVIALIVLERDDKFILNDRILPIALPTFNNESADSLDPLASYYATGYRGHGEQELLRYQIMRVGPLDQCRRILHKDRVIRYPAICASGTDLYGVAATYGKLNEELGVPLVYLRNATLVGIFQSSNSVGIQGVFARVDNFVSWIKLEMLYMDGKAQQYADQLKSNGQ